ncbi:hypothetical protein BX616_009793 [Lobosporangium transversale]|uniref:Galactose oxidase n=1 Tax=Lobosporangium transversale TaxID=64571 RepID=A0A1Y2GMZ2_9FUNG|nr:hypothetical protein BCR41DRAFT_397685 [Lobosporangium transversale]KAF9913640.1 hypothetical protein BX616_009793 [Lobosporangium transversale]ORZ12098.1 hypothetical protein BCR41DRAFT_397685 [Lobosporangium transversale]|eukprot:XP_021879963.1 hypothetical protein BCR41DRAFT_397685 [Lobosporangium transversale]
MEKEKHKNHRLPEQKRDIATVFFSICNSCSSRLLHARISPSPTSQPSPSTNDHSNPYHRQRITIPQKISPSFFLDALLNHHRPHITHRPHIKHSLSPLSLSAFFLSLFALPKPILSQQQQQEQEQQFVMFTPRYSSGSVVVNKKLYVISGTTLELEAKSTDEILLLPLDKPFLINSVLWQRLGSGGVFANDARVAASADGSYIVMVGMGEPNLIDSSTGPSPMARVYDIQANSWQYFSQLLFNVNSPQYSSRISESIVLDSSTGVIVIYGGYSLVSNFVLSDVTLIATSSSHDFNSWSWSPPAPNNQMGPLFQPVMVYLPHLRATLVMGGCRTFSTTSSGSNCSSFTFAYLLQTQVTSFGNATYSLSGVTLKGGNPLNTTVLTPPSRMSPCHVVLNNGDVFMYGGSTTEGSLSDSWILRTKDWTWSMVTINNAPTQSRAGATCQLVTPNQIVVVGGYEGAASGPKQFSLPQLGIINTDKWSWAANFEPNGGAAWSLPPGAIIGIVVGAGLILCVIGLIAWRIFSMRRKTHELNEGHNPQSSEPLMDDGAPHFQHDSCYNMNTMNKLDVLLSASTRSASFTPSLESNSSNGIGGNSSNRSLVSRAVPGFKSPLPLIITPYSPAATMSSGSFSMTPTDPSSFNNHKKQNKQKNHHDTLNNKTNIDLPESERLPQQLADMQYGHYIRTLQHNKQYEKRRSDLQNLSPSLRRVDTTVLHDKIWEEGSNNDNHPEDRPYLVTGLINLRDVDVGEEPMSVPTPSLETGPMLISSHIDTSRIITSTVDTGLQQEQHQQRQGYIPVLGDTHTHDDAPEYVPGVGGSKEAKTNVGGRGGTMSGFEQAFGRAEIISNESIESELVDNRKIRRGN